MAAPCFFQNEYWGALGKTDGCEASRTRWFFVGNVADLWDCLLQGLWVLNFHVGSKHL